MKLLFDENLSPRLVGALANIYPGSAHVHECGLGSGDDAAIWQYAKDNGFTIVSKDSGSLMSKCTCSGITMYPSNRNCSSSRTLANSLTKTFRALALKLCGIKP